MFFVRHRFYVGMVLTSFLFTATVCCVVGKASLLGDKNIHWFSFDFKTILMWKPRAGGYLYTVKYSHQGEDWVIQEDCFRTSETECDLTNHLRPLNRIYIADVQSELLDGTPYDPEELSHTISQDFNPYTESNISAASFSVEMGDDNSSVTLRISDPVTPLYQLFESPGSGPRPSAPAGVLLSVRDILQEDLKYQIYYYRAGRTGKKEATISSSTAEIVGLEPGASYCFSVRAFIPSRAPPHQHGAWSHRQCTQAQPTSFLEELQHGALVGAFILLLSALVTLVSLGVLCWYCQKTHKVTEPHPSASRHRGNL